jgi:hypothetical protein
MKRSILTVITCAVWLSGVSSAAALTYVLDRPLTPVASATEMTRHAGVMHRASALDLPGTFSVHHARPLPPAPRAAAVHVVLPQAPPEPRDIADMSCAPPRELDMGSGHVQICE